LTEEADNASNNDHIIKYLKYYCDRENSFDFGVMINGPWGVGKTFLIKSFVTSLKQEKSITSIYISLYGKTLPSQIDDDIFLQLHPVLGSKGIKILGLVAKGLIKSATKIDLGKIETVTLNAELPNINLTEMFPSPRDCLIVFDDLERCSIPIIDVLGYINSFVEHENVKTVVIANEKDIESRDEFERYKIIKEKLIGKTLEVRSVEARAIRSFIDSIRNSNVKDFLMTEIEQIIDIHKRSESNNLRVLRQGIWEFERLATCFRDNHWKSAKAMRLILSVILALSYEIKLGRLSQEELSSVMANSVARMMRRQNKATPPTSADKVQDRYPNVDFDQIVISPTTIGNLLLRGWMDRTTVLNEINASSFFADPATEPAWKTALGVWRLEDEAIEAACKTLEGQFAARKFSEPGEMFMIFGARLFLSEVGLLGKDKTNIRDECIKYINGLKANNNISNKYKGNAVPGGDFDSWGGYRFPCGDTPEFKSILAHYTRIVDEVNEDAIPSIARELLDLMRSDPTKFSRLLFINAFEDSPFRDTPILNHIRVDEFVDVLLLLGPEAQSAVIAALKLRYERGGLASTLAQEAPWLKELDSALRSKLETLRPASRFRIKSRLETYVAPYLTL
jgi:GTPase SAR1 family protein